MHLRILPFLVPSLLILALAGVGCSTPDGTPAARQDRADDASPTPQPTPSASPAQGLIAGTPFEVETSTIENGILELRQGEEFLADRKLMIFLFLDEGVVPENRTFEVGADTGFGAPHIHMSWKPGQDAMPETEVFMNEYAMRLEFGAEEDGVLPGRIELELPDEAQSRVSGTFAAKIGGFRRVGGKPDYTKDSLQNLRYLAADHLRETLGPDVEIVTVEHGWFRHAGNDGRIQTGAADVTYAVDGRTELGRFLFVKEPDAWRVDRILDPSQLAEAHPYQEPVADDFERAVIAWKVAEAVEAHARELHAGSAIFPGDDFSVIETYSTGAEGARVQASYRVDGADEPVRMELRLVRDGESWRVESMTPAARQDG